jgi:hypothetical protein
VRVVDLALVVYVRDLIRGEKKTPGSHRLHASMHAMGGVAVGRLKSPTYTQFERNQEEHENAKTPSRASSKASHGAPRPTVFMPDPGVECPCDVSRREMPRRLQSSNT